MSWHDYIDDSDPGVQEFAGWLAGLPPFVQTSVVGSIDALTHRAAAGLLVLENNELDAIRRDPDLFELRWTALDKLLRQYHAEPGSHPDVLIKLLLHIKGSSTRRDDSAPARQKAAIERAATRYRAGATLQWGMKQT